MNSWNLNEDVTPVGRAGLMRRAAVAVVAVLVSLAGSMFYLFLRDSAALTEPAHSVIGLPPADLSGEEISFKSESGVTLKGWFLQGHPGRGAILLLHGNRSNRRGMLSRARLFKTHGYSILMIDLQGHGESGGDTMTFGLRESMDARTAVQYLHQRVPQERVAALGTSLGGAAHALASPSLGADAVIMESVYSTIEQAAENRLRMHIGFLAPIARPFLIWRVSSNLGISASSLHPIEKIAEIGCPVLIAAGTEDIHTSIAESKALCEAAREPKECWWVSGAAHTDLYAYSPAEYEKRIIGFLEKHLGRIPLQPREPMYDPRVLIE